MQNAASVKGSKENKTQKPEILCAYRQNFSALRFFITKFEITHQILKEDLRITVYVKYFRD